MAKSITTITEPVLSEKEANEKAWAEVLEELSRNSEGLRSYIRLLQELHESGIMDTMKAALQSKEELAKVIVKEMNKPNNTNTINNLMAMADTLSMLDSDVVKKMASSVSTGFHKAREENQTEEKIGLFDLMKALKDPDINRAVRFGLNFLKGMGQSLGEKGEK